MRTRTLLLLVLGLCGWSLPAQVLETKPNDPAFARFLPAPAPPPGRLILKRGDRVALCGDSITEQKMYSRILETYLTVCVPELKITVRQYGWSGERAPGFLARLTNDCLRFHPTIATTCYGMNDHEYRPYEDRIGRTYRESSSAIVEAFKAHGARVILGSPGCVGRIPPWSQAKGATVEALNLNLCELRNLDVQIAGQEKVGFADVFWPMLVGGFEAQKRYGPDYALAGKDGVHPGWAGHLVMAYAFLKAMGLEGDLGTFTVDWAEGRARASAGHRVIAFRNGELQLESRHYPFCAAGDPTRDDSIRSGMTLVPFNAELNRLRLVVRGGTARSYRVTWGEETKSYPAAQLAQGVNLAEEFVVNPFSAAFKKVDEAVAAKQNYETRQIKDLFHGPEGRAEPKRTAALTERVRRPLAGAIRAAFVPVTHTIRITPE